MTKIEVFMKSIGTNLGKDNTFKFSNLAGLLNQTVR